MLNHYLLLKALHIFGVIIFLGNIIITGYWKVMADRTRNPSIIAFAQRQVTYTDLIFTTLAVLLILATGLKMAQAYGGFTQIKWILWGLILFIISGIIWVLILIPIQIIQHRMANRFSKTNVIPQNYWYLANLWLGFGTIATLLPLMNIYWMVFKPA